MHFFDSILLPALISTLVAAVVAAAVTYLMGPTNAARQEKGRSRQQARHQLRTAWLNLGAAIESAHEVARDSRLEVDDEVYFTALLKVGEEARIVDQVLLMQEKNADRVLKPVTSECKTVVQQIYPLRIDAYSTRSDTTDDLLQHWRAANEKAKL